MRFTVTFIHAKHDKKIKDYATEKLQKLTRFHSKVEEIKVRLIEQKGHRNKETDFYCEVIIRVPGHIVEIVDVERAFDKAIDKALERAKRALVKNKEKHISKDHKLGLKRKAKTHRR